jgi:putative endonuclease
MYYVYAIRSRSRNYIYVGLTDNPDRRIKEHNNKKESTTRPYVPFDVVTIEEHETRIKAREREKYLKSGFGKEYLKSL